MRWRFPNPLDEVEAGERSHVTHKIDAWWTAFQARASNIDALFKRKQQWDLVDWMRQGLDPINSELMWEYGPGLMGGNRLVITPESKRNLRPLVEVILQRAPKIAGWEFYGYRLPEDLQQTIAAVKGRTKGDISKTKFHAHKGKYNRLDLLFTSPHYHSENEEKARNDCFVASETSLGEEVLDKWIGRINVAPEYLNSPEFLSLDQLLPEVRRQIANSVKALPDQSCLAISNTATWTMYKLKPDEATDYSGQLDMFVGKTMLTEMWLCGHSNQVFDSVRFSKHGELFVYLKLDGSQGLDLEKFKDKAEIEDALDELLIGEKLGCVVGGGTGKRYSYIDMALMRPELAIEKIRLRLQDGNVTKRSWILFYDDTLRDEWIGIWDDTPPPPR